MLITLHFRNDGSNCARSFKFSLFWISFLTFAFSCTSGRMNDELKKIELNEHKPSGIEIYYPQDSTLFPPEISAPRFKWKDTSGKSTKWFIRLTSVKAGNVFCGTVPTNEWRPDSVVWEKLKTLSSYGPVLFTVAGTAKGTVSRPHPTGRVAFSFSKDSVLASVFYRAVPLPFGYAVKHVNEIEWYVGKVSGGKPKRVLNNIPVCANCHSFSKTGILAMDVDYANDKGSYIITPMRDTVSLSIDKIITWSDYRREDAVHTYGLLSQISQDGNYVLSTVKDRSVFVALDKLEYSQLFFPVKGIIAIYDRHTKKFSALPGASDPKYVQSNPSWSPDGKDVVFTRTNSYMSNRLEKSEGVLLKQEDVSEFTQNHKEFKFNLYRIAFNDGKGGPAIPIPGASANHKSNFFAKYSPDGKWIVFCQAENYMLLQPDSRLFIMPATGGDARLMRCNTGKMNSWHSWSPNSRWLVFSSKLNGPYTQLYITHIDENGIDSPPVLLENMVFDKRAANIPEFFDNRKYGMNIMNDDFSDNAMYYNRSATENIRQHDYRDALKNSDKALEKDSTYYDAFKNKLFVSFTLGQSGSKENMRDRARAERLIARDRAQHPGDRSQLAMQGELHLLMQDYDQALHDGQDLVQTNTDEFHGYNLISEIYMQKGEPERAIPYLKKMQSLQPDNMQVRITLAALYKDTKQWANARELLEELIQQNPAEARFYSLCAKLFHDQNKIKEALTYYNRAVSLDSENYVVYNDRGMFFARNMSPDLARKDLNKSLELLNLKITRSPQDAPLYINRAQEMEQMGNILGALSEYENYLKKWPLNYDVLKREAQIYYSMKQLPKAIDIYKTMIDNFYADPRVLVGRSIAYMETGYLQLALKDIDKAITLEQAGYSYVYSDYYFRSGVKSRMGDKAGAVADLRTTFDLLKEQQSKRSLEKKELDLMASIQRQLN